MVLVKYEVNGQEFYAPYGLSVEQVLSYNGRVLGRNGRVI